MSKPKNVIVTGATSGIGEAIARKFSSEGLNVALIGRRKDKGEQIVNDIVSNGGNAFFVQTDVTDSKSVTNMYKTCLEKFQGKPVSILVNNAGINAGNAPIEYVTEENWDNVMNTSAKGTFLCSKAVIPDMIKNGGGSIVNISSAGAFRGYVGGTAYASAKTAVNSLTKIIAFEHGKDNIRTNCICPGSIHTEMFDGSINTFSEKMKNSNGESLSVDQIFANIAKGIPLGRIGESEDIAELVSWLSSDKASFINGAIITIDGGQTL